MANDSRTVKATTISFELIEEIHRHNNPNLSELADTTGYAKSTVHAHLNTLRELNYVVKRAGRYQLGMKLLHLGEQARFRNPLYELAREAVLDLAETTNEEVDFTVAEYGRLTSVHHSIEHSGASGSQVGSYFHMHNTASGKAILAEWPEERVDEVIDTWGLPAETEQTITERSKLFEELDLIRERGYAINDQELLDAFRSIAIAVKTPDGRVLGGLSIGGPAYRLDPDEYRGVLRDRVETLEERLEAGSASSENWWEPYMHSES